mmetsp:Transcript_35646/g.79283  ORF Transcript_35646/g.79283 Transcript_35646/m.79283 type:complete len:253 (+) Transcript_35646:295-1053(+)
MWWMRPTWRPTASTRPSSTTRCTPPTAHSGWQLSWSAVCACMQGTRTSPPSSCGPWAMRPATGRHTWPWRRTCALWTTPDPFTTRAVARAPPPRTSSAPCTPASPSCAPCWTWWTGGRRPGPSFCASTATPWATAQATCQSTGSCLRATPPWWGASSGTGWTRRCSQPPRCHQGRRLSTGPMVGTLATSLMTASSAATAWCSRTAARTPAWLKSRQCRPPSPSHGRPYQGQQGKLQRGPVSPTWGPGMSPRV